MSRRWQKRPEGSTWGDFGDDDQRGRMNLVTPERVRAAAGEVREGLSFCLSLPLGELWYLSELAAYLRARGRNRFLLTAPPLRLPGAVGSPATPVATV